MATASLFSPAMAMRRVILQAESTSEWSGSTCRYPVPLAYYTFGGWKRSGFGDLNQHGPDAFKFYTRTKTITSRWPSGIKEGAEFSIPTMG